MNKNQILFNTTVFANTYLITWHGLMMLAPVLVSKLTHKQSTNFQNSRDKDNDSKFKDHFKVYSYKFKLKKKK